MKDYQKFLYLYRQKSFISFLNFTIYCYLYLSLMKIDDYPPRKNN